MMHRFKKHPFITGTVILTLTGLFSRIIGFFYRIYLSRLFGEEGMGVYQLTGPVLSLSFALTVAGIQTAISKYVAAQTASKNHRAALKTLLSGLLVSLILSLLCMGLIIRFSEEIALYFLCEPRTASMLRIIALSIPLCAVHCCINGYFYGIQKTGIPSATQLIEQFCRIFCVFFADYMAVKRGSVPTINAAVIGLVAGEFCATVVSLLAIYLHFCKLSVCAAPSASYPSISFRLLSLALPLSLNRIVISLLQSVESVYIPEKLQSYGYDTATALSVYGVLTGMALPLVLFPNALTGSISLMLLPVVSEADSTGNRAAVRHATRKTVFSCLVLGGICTLGFLLFGNFLGNLLFRSPLAGKFICSLSFICPFLYLCTTLTGILHGLGKTMSIFFINVSSLCIRLFFIFFLLPSHGIGAYIHGMLFSQVFSAVCLYLLLKRQLK